MTDNTKKKLIVIKKCDQGMGKGLLEKSKKAWRVIRKLLCYDLLFILSCSLSSPIEQQILSDLRDSKSISTVLNQRQWWCCQSIFVIRTWWITFSTQQWFFHFTFQSNNRNDFRHNRWPFDCKLFSLVVKLIWQST